MRHNATSGAFHSREIPFLFQTLEKNYKEVSDGDRKMASAFSGYFANFAKSHNADDPNGLQTWRPFDSSFQLMHFRRHSLLNPNDQIPNFEPEPWGGVKLVEQVASCP